MPVIPGAGEYGYQEGEEEVRLQQRAQQQGDQHREGGERHREDAAVEGGVFELEHSRLIYRILSRVRESYRAATVRERFPPTSSHRKLIQSASSSIC